MKVVLNKKVGRRGDKQKFPRFGAAKDMENPEFRISFIFRDTDELKKVVPNYVVKWGKDIRFMKNEKWRVTAICKGENGMCLYHIPRIYLN